MPSDPIAHLILARALASAYGITLTTNDPMKAKMHLYKARAESKSAALQCLQIRTVEGGELWVVKGPGVEVK